MNKFFLSAVIALAASSAVAQESSEPSEGATSSGISSPAGEGSLAAPGTILEPVKRFKDWTGAVFYSPYSGFQTVNRGEAADNYVADAFVQARRDIGGGQRMALRVNAHRNQTDADQNDEWALGDPQLIYTNPFFASTFRLSFPVMEWSQDIGRYELRYNGGWDIAKQGRMTVSGLTEARGYAYTEQNDGQRAWRGRLGASAMYEINSIVSPYVVALYQIDGNYGGEGLEVEGGMGNPASRVDKTIVDLGAEVNLIPKVLHLNAFIEQERRRDAGADKELFAEADSTYYLEFTLSL